MKVISKDGTEIGYEKQGKGPTVILVDGALGFRSLGWSNELAKLLSSQFMVITYDRRGRGESSDNKPFAVKREIEDIEELIDKHGGYAYLYGVSSGACLGLEAAIELDGKIKKLAMFEPPYNSDENSRQEWENYRKNLRKALAENHRGDAVALFMKLVGVTDDQIERMRQMPMWSMLESVAPTLEYDAAAVGLNSSVPFDRVSHVTAQVLVMYGDRSYPFMKDTALMLSKVIPNAQLRALKGQTHEAPSDVIAPVLIEFFKN